MDSDVPRGTIQSPYLTAEDAASYLLFPSVSYFRKAVRKFGIPCIRRGRRLFFTRQQLDQFMAVATESTAPARKRRTKAA